MVSDTLQKVSGLLSGPSILHVEVAKISDTIVNAVKKLPSVSNLVKTGNILRIQMKTHEVTRAQVSKEITQSAGIIIGMNQKASNLEDVFIQLVHKDQGGKPQ